MKIILMLTLISLCFDSLSKVPSVQLCLLSTDEGYSNKIHNDAFEITDTVNATEELIALVNHLAKAEKNPLLKRHYKTLAVFANDTTHGFLVSESDQEQAAKVLEFMKNDGSTWETYLNGPRPLMMSFKSHTDGKYSYYWLILPKGFDGNEKEFPLYMELHGSGGGSNDNPRKMLYMPLQPEVAGVTSQGYRKEGFYVYPWGRGDKWYRDTAEADVFEVLNDFDKMFKTDSNKQYLYGFSMGGAGTFRIAQKSMERWAALGVYSGAMNDPTLEDALKFKTTPVWMAWGEEERIAEVNRLVRDLFIEAGVDLTWQEIEGVGHKYLGEYQEELMDWLKSKKREE